MTQRTRVSILNSRQSSAPLGCDPWLHATLEAVRHAVDQGWEIATSIGMSTWEFLVWAVGRAGGSQRIFLPRQSEGSEPDEIIRNFDLDRRQVAIEIIAGTDHRTAKSWWSRRDTMIVESADVIVPIAIRPGGNLERLIESPARDGIPVDRQFQIDDQSRRARRSTDYMKLLRDASVSEPPGEWLIHWTRSTQGPWPGETSATYFRDLISAHDGINPRSACATVKRMIAERRIRASRWKVGGKAAVTAFTAMGVAESLAALRWRARFQRWNYEPYGIAIDRAQADTLDVRPVRYISSQEMKRLPNDEKPLCHAVGGEAVDWRAEKEWRAIGDIDLSQCPPQSIIVYVLTEDESSRLNVPTGWRIIPILDT